jgi:hypothetical protein
MCPSDTFARRVLTGLDVHTCLAEMEPRLEQLFASTLPTGAWDAMSWLQRLVFLNASIANANGSTSTLNAQAAQDGLMVVAAAASRDAAEAASEQSQELRYQGHQLPSNCPVQDAACTHTPYGAGAEACSSASSPHLATPLSAELPSCATTANACDASLGKVVSGAAASDTLSATSEVFLGRGTNSGGGEICKMAGGLQDKCGVGVTFVKDGAGYFVIKSMIQGGAGDKAGLQVGHRLLRVDGHDVHSITPIALSTFVLGEQGSDVVFELAAADDDAKHTVCIQRSCPRAQLRIPNK